MVCVACVPVRVRIPELDSVPLMAKPLLPKSTVAPTPMVRLLNAEAAVIVPDAVCVPLPVKVTVPVCAVKAPPLLDQLPPIEMLYGVAVTFSVPAVMVRLLFAVVVPERLNGPGPLTSKL